MSKFKKIVYSGIILSSFLFFITWINFGIFNPIVYFEVLTKGDASDYIEANEVVWCKTQSDILSRYTNLKKVSITVDKPGLLDNEFTNEQQSKLDELNLLFVNSLESSSMSKYFMFHSQLDYLEFIQYLNIKNIKPSDEKSYEDYLLLRENSKLCSLWFKASNG
tara:strand:- start:428 stop:919 length:492 start_codon:yes stop_codon:yes gene_type:complete